MLKVIHDLGKSSGKKQKNFNKIEKKNFLIAEERILKKGERMGGMKSLRSYCSKKFLDKQVML